MQDAPPCTKGCISLSNDFGCTVSVRSFRSYRPAVISNVLMDTGGQISAVSEATLARLLRENAVDNSDIIHLEAPHYVQGWDKQQPPKAINRMVLLRVIPEAPDGRESAQFEHGFLILPHLSKAMIIGRDVINRHGYRMSSNGADSTGSVLELGTVDESQLHDRLAQQAQSVQLIEAVDSTCGWQLIAVEPVAMRADQDTHVLVRVVSFNGAPVLDADDKDIAVEVRHAALHPTTIVVGAGVMTVVLRAAGSDFTLERGAILGEASLTAAVPDEVHTPSESTLMRVMDLSCGAGGFTHGVAGRLNVVLGVDTCEAALQVYAANHGSAGCIQADVHLPADRDEIVRAATALQVQVVIGSTQTADSQYSTTKRAQCGLGLTRWRQCPVQSWGCSAAVRGCGTWMQSWTRCKHMQREWAFKRTVSTSLLKTVDSPCAQVGLYLCCSGHCSRRHLRYSRSCQSWQDLSVTLAARWGSRVCGKRVHITEAVTGSPTVATTGQAVRPGHSQCVVHRILCLVQLWQPLYSRGCAPRQTAHLSVCLGQT